MPEIIWDSEFKIYFTYMWNPKYDRNETDSQTQRIDLQLPVALGGGRGEVRGKTAWEVGLADANY